LGPTAAKADSLGDDSTPSHTARKTRASAASRTKAPSNDAAAVPLFPERLRQEESRFHSLGEFPIGGFLCVTDVATEADTATPFGVIVNIPSVGTDAESLAIEDLGLVAGETLGDPIPVNPSAVSFMAGSLRDATRGPSMSDRPLERWTSHEEHVGFLQGHKLCRSVICFGNKAIDAPLPSDPDLIKVMWSPDAADQTIKGRKAETPGEPCITVAVADPNTAADALSFWMMTVALPLPEGHNLPPGFIWDPRKATCVNFIARIAEWSGRPMSDWDWFLNGLTTAWFKATAYSPQSFATQMFPLADLAPTIEGWKLEPAEPSATARHRHIVYAADLLRHRYFRDNIFAHASATMTARLSSFESCSLATIRATTGLRTLAKHPALAAYLFHWCTPETNTWSQTYGFHVYSETFAPPAGERRYTPKAVDYRQPTQISALAFPPDASSARTPQRDQPGEPAAAASSAVMQALLHGNVTSPPTKRKRQADHSASPSRPPPANRGITRATGSSLDNPLAVDTDAPVSPPAIRGTRLAYAAPPALAPPSAPVIFYHPSEHIVPEPAAAVERYWRTRSHLCPPLPTAGHIPTDNPFSKQLIATPAEPLPATSIDPKRNPPPPGFTHANCIAGTVPLGLRCLSHFTAWSTQPLLLYPADHDASTGPANPFHVYYSLTPGKLSHAWTHNVAPPAKRGTAGAWLLENKESDILYGGTGLPFLPEGFNNNFVTTNAFDLLRNGPFVASTAISSASDFTKGFHPHLLLLTLEGLTEPLIPRTGFSANQLRRLIDNFGWLLHTSVYDGSLLRADGDTRSSFTEHSPLAWILGEVLVLLRQKLFSQTWQKLSDRRASYSWGFLRSINELWDMFFSWGKPRNARNHYHLAAPAAPHTAGEIILLFTKLPSDPTEAVYLQPSLAKWLTTFKTRFAPDNLGVHGGGPFFHSAIPDHLIQPATRHPLPRQQLPRQQERNPRPPLQRPPGGQPPTDRLEQRPANFQHPDRQTPRPSTDRPDPSEYNTASTPLLEWRGRDTSLMRLINSAGPPPTFTPPGAPHPIQYCFSFIMAGCRMPQCSRMHIDIVTATVSARELKAAVQPLWEFIKLPLIAAELQPTPAFAQLMHP
jgi:hypothetical protein